MGCYTKNWPKLIGLPSSCGVEPRGSGPDRPAAGCSALAAAQACARCYLCTAGWPLPGCGAEIGPVPSTCQESEPTEGVYRTDPQERAAPVKRGWICEGW